MKHTRWILRLSSFLLVGACLPLGVVGDTTSRHEEMPRMSIVNMTCDFFQQPLNHFVPRGQSPTYLQRYCVYDDFTNNETAPIFFYTGNESPMETYINHTGLMWELAPRFEARVVFAEHRYEGMSLPQNLTTACASYASSVQALADFARLLQHLQGRKKAPVIAFGGSYGGMLSAWFKYKYPNMVAGAIAASAPIWALPKVDPTNIDSAAKVIQHGLKLPYPPTQTDTDPTQNHCATNLLTAWPLLTYLGRNQGDTLNRFLAKSFRLCQETIDNVQNLLNWAHSPWFDMAEGSFPYPSNYIPFALVHDPDVTLPAWPVQAACWEHSELHKDWGIRLEGDTEAVLYNITYGDSGLILSVDWDTLEWNSVDAEILMNSSSIQGLLESVRDAVSVWYNMTHRVSCYDISEAAPNKESTANKRQFGLKKVGTEPQQVQRRGLGGKRSAPPASTSCDDKIKEGSWDSLCCNDELNLIITEAHGLGHDSFWPPSHPRGTRNHQDVIRVDSPWTCPDPDGIFGYPPGRIDPWSTWMDVYYGGRRITDSLSNVVFSNGLLDPWSVGGVVPDGRNGRPVSYTTMNKMIRTAPWAVDFGNNVIALAIEFGGHHTDLMHSHPADPESVVRARELETYFIAKWIDNWNI